MKAKIFSFALMTLAFAAFSNMNHAAAENILTIETTHGITLRMPLHDIGEQEEPLPYYVVNQAADPGTIEVMNCLNLSFKDFLLLIQKPEQEEPLPFELS